MTVDHTPGHTRGSVVFRVVGRWPGGGRLHRRHLFRQSVGRTDLPGGSGRDLLGSIVTKLLVLDDDTVVLPGHGEKTTIGFERRTNPFLEGLTYVTRNFRRPRASRTTCRRTRRSSSPCATACSTPPAAPATATSNCPIFEDTALFARGVGESTDVVSKEMYTFADRGDRSVTLRPEGTAGVMRAVIEHGLDRGPLPVKLCYAGPFFRYERPQAGRYRQLQQVGVEAIGVDDPALDAEVIAVADAGFRSLGLDGFRLEITSLGDDSCRPQYRELLQDFLFKLDLDEETRRRAEINPLRVLDDKRPHDARDDGRRAGDARSPVRCRPSSTSTRCSRTSTRSACRM